ncbi:MAG: hypothetical protein GWN93_06800 [Deltaproteobacteria bacterium]|nr:hypothetical protein [Deltaproteobacteria bacterium]
MTDEIKVGSEVWFKNDVEGSGIVARVRTIRGWNGPYKEYDIRSKSEPNGYRFHRMARFDSELNAMVVTVDEDHIWL